METFLTLVKYGAVFFGLYIQVFLLFTYLGWGSSNQDDGEEWNDEALFPTVAVIVPCFNEEVGVVRTIESLLASDYPKEKLEIIVVNDGSTDNTWNILQQYAGHPGIMLHTKRNGGKYTALNFGLEQTKAAIVGCLDADSTIAPDAIRQSIGYFLRDSEAQAVVPAMTVENPKTFIQLIQKVEFEAALYTREVFGKLSALFVAPGPLTLFRKEVFEKLGPYKHGYLGEDLEIAVRMQFNNMKLVFGRRSRVYTFGMKTFKTLIKQRVRWTYAFVMNMKDYRKMLLNPKYGHLGFFILPIAIIAILLALILTPIALYQLGVSLWTTVQPILWGVSPTGNFHFDAFYINPQALTLLGIIAIGFAFMATFIGRSMTNHKWITWDLGTLIIYPFISTWWMIKTAWKIIRSEQVTWR